MRAKLTTVAMCGGLLASIPQPFVATGAATMQSIAQDAAILTASRASPGAFVRALLDMYRDGNVPLEQLPDNRPFFSVETAALIDRLASENPEGVFSADPFLRLPGLGVAEGRIDRDEHDRRDACHCESNAAR